MTVTDEYLATGRLWLRMLGSPSVTDADGEVLAGLGPGKPLALLCYLAREGEARREELTALLWGDVDEARARNAFRQSLHRLRQGLGGMLVQQQDRLSLAPGDSLWCDVNAFEAALERDDVATAIALYRGDFLEGLVIGEPSFDLWVDRQRVLLRTQIQSALENGARASIASASWEEAVSRAVRLTTVAPYEADAALLLANALEGSGRRREAAAALAEFAARCEEIGVPVPPEIRERIARGAPARQERTAATPPHSVAPAALVGRAEAMAVLNSAWARARRGEGTTVLLTGDTGSGKTRLLDEFSRALSALDNPLLLRGSDARGARLPYASVAEAMRGTVRAPGLAGASEHLLAEAARIVPEFRDRFQLPPGGPVEDDAARLRFFEGVAAVLEAVSYEQPVCMLLDALEHGAPATADLILYLSARLRSCSILIACAGGPRTFDRFTAGTGRLGDQVVQLALTPLNATDSAALVASLPEAAALSAPDRDRIAAMGNGNPLRLLELTRQLAGGAALAAPLVPLHDILAERLQSLPATHRRLFLAAALFGGPTSLRLLAASAHLSEPATLDAALELERDGLVVQSPAGVAPAHNMVAELAIEQAGAAGAALIAGWAADALAIDQPHRHAELADLYARAGRAAESYRHSLSAADDALRVGAFSEARQFLERAAEFAPDAAARQDVLKQLELVGGGWRRLSAGETRAPASQSIFSDPRLPSRWLLAALIVLGISAIALSIARTARQRPVGHVIADTVVLVETESPGDNHFFGVTGQVAAATGALMPMPPVSAQPAWIDSVRVPWMNPHPSPDGGFVAIERMTESGPDLFVVASDRGDTLAVATAAGDDFALDWAPDGRALLVSRSRTRVDGSYDTDLYLFRLADRSLLPLDTAVAREIVDAAWSPDGARILWTARVSALNQQEIFVGRADGSGMANLSRHPADDFRPAWAPDGTRVVYTSERDGNAELYSTEISSGAVTRLTWDDAQDDRAAFSPDGRFIAFESTRGGSSGVYVMASRGGQPARISPAARRMSLAGWRNDRSPYIERVRLAHTGSVAPGDSVPTFVEALMSDGSVRPIDGVDVRPLDGGVAIGSRGGGLTLIGLADGISRVTATLPGWRLDTLMIKVGNGALLALSDDFAARDIGRETWSPIGAPPPLIIASTAGGAGGMLVPATSRGAQTGLLSRQSFPASYGLSLRARMLAPFGHALPSSLVLSIVERPTGAALGSDAPAFLPLASVTWIGEARRIAYAVEREVKTEPAAALADAPAHEVEIRVENDGRVAFFVDGTLRWRSTLRFSSGAPVSDVSVWLAGQTRRADTGFDDVQLWIGETPEQ